MDPTDLLPHPMPALAPWVGWRTDRCRGGRLLITAVNHRDGQAVHLDAGDLDPADPERRGEALAELAEGGFTMAESDAVPPHGPGGGAPDVAGALPPGFGLVWRGADRSVRRWHDRALRHLFRPGWVAAQAVLALVGIAAVVATWRTGGIELHAHPAQIPAIVLLGLVAVAIHELGHALVTVHHGRTVRMAGVRLHLGAPAFYVESIDALLLDRRQRLLQAAAGPWAEWLVTSVVAVSFLALTDHRGAVALVLHRFVVVNTIVLASNLAPFVGLDGALLLGDLICEPDLTFRARTVLLPGARPGPRDRRLAAYAVANAMFGTGLLVMSAFFWWQLFGGLAGSLWATGPFGVAAVLLAAALLARQVVQLVAATVVPWGPPLRHLWTRVVFRMERRWRVRAMHTLRARPEIASLDERALGILAGHLVRRPTGVPANPGALAVAGRRHVMELPAGWTQLLDEAVAAVVSG